MNKALGAVQRLFRAVAPILLAAPAGAQSFGIISTFAGTGVAGYSGDNGPAIGAQVNTPRGLAIDAGGNVYIADSGNNRIRKISGGTISLFAGTGSASFGGDNGQAVNAQINQPRSIIVDSSGNLYIADTANNRVRKVDSSGIITTIAGTGTPGSGGDGGQATAAQLNNPYGLALDSAGNLYIADAFNFKIRRVDPSGVITTYAGTGTPGSTGDGGQAAAATFQQPFALAVDSAGNLYVSDASANRIRKITASTGVITTFGGTGGANYSGDGGPAPNAQLNGPAGMVFDSAGNLYFADLNNNRVRKIDTSGIISTVAGNGSASYTNDGQFSVNAGIGSPIGLAIDPSGRLYIAQRDFAVVRIVGPTGPPSRLIPQGGTGQSTPVGTAFPQPLAVLVTDAFGSALSGITVTFTPPASGASATLSSGTAVTNANGVASVTATANGVTGSYQVVATVTGVSPPATFDLTNAAGTSSRVVFLTQPRDTAAGTTINTVIVQVIDGSGNPIPGVPVTMTAQGGDGSLTGTTTETTKSNGRANFNDIQINVTGTYQLKAVAGSAAQLSNSFNITTASSRNITVLSGDSQMAAIGTAYASPLKASVLDSLGNPIPGASVTFTAPSSGPTVSFGGSATVTTDSNGVATSPRLTANSQTGAFQVMAATSGAPLPAAFNLTNVAGTANRLAFVQQPSNAASAQAIAPPVTVQLQDSFGNAVAQAGVAVTLQANPLTQRSGTLLGTTTQTTNSAGLATFANLSIAQAGTYQLVASAQSLSGAQSNSFIITSGNPASIAVSSGSPQSATISTAFAGPLAVAVRDAAGNPVSGATVTFAAPASGPSATLSAAQAITDATGGATVTATANSIAGSYTVTASVSGVTGTAAFALTNVAAGASVLAFVQQPVSTTAGATISAVTVKLTDSGNNPVSGVAVTLTAQGGSGTLEGTLTVATDVTGTATFNDLAIRTTGTYLLRAAAGTLSAVSSKFQITPAAAANITVFDGNGQTAAVGAAYTAPLRARVQDAFGNPIAGAQVTFQPPAGGASVSFAGSATVTTDSSGIAASPVATANQTAGGFQVTATTPGAPQPATFNLTNVAGTANKLAFVQQPGTTNAGQPITPPVTVQLQDSFGNSVAMAGVNVSIQASPVAGLARTLHGTATVATDSTGRATFANLSLDQAGTYTLLAQATGVTSATSAPFLITAGSAAAIQASGGTPQSATINTPFANALQATVKDALGNAVSGVTVTFTAPGSGASAALSSPTAVTDAGGHASVTAAANLVAGAYTVTAAASGVGGTAGFALTNLSAGAASLVFVEQPASTTAGATISAVSVRIADSNNNPVSGITVTLSAQGGSGTLEGTVSVATDVTGTATFNDLVIRTAGTYLLRAAAGTFSAVSSKFQITPAAAANITVLDGNGQTAAVGAAYTAPLRARVVDAFGNAIAGAQVTFQAPAGGASVGFAGSGTVTTDSSGIAASPVATANQTAGGFQVTATTPGAPQPATFNLTNVAGTANKLAFVQQPGTTVAGQPITPPVTVQLQDSFGNSVAMAGVNVSIQASPVAGLARTLHGTATVATDSTGRATFANLSLDQAGTYTLLAQATGVTSATSAPFLITAGSAAAIQASGGTPQSATINTPFVNALQATVKDALGNAVSGVTVTFTAPGSGASAALSSPTAVTDAGGHASVTATANLVAGAYTVMAAASGAGGTAGFALTNLAAGAASLVFVQQPASTTAGATIGAVSVRIADSNNNPVSGITVTMSAQGGSGTLEGTLTGTTDITGTATFDDLRITATGTYQLQAVAGALSASSGTFQIAPAAAANVTVFDGNGQTAAVGTAYTAPLRASVVDAFGNPVANAAVTFAAPATGASVTFAAPATVTTNAMGIAAAPAATANGTPGTFQVTAMTPGAPQPATFNLTNVSGTADKLTFVQQPTDTVAGETIVPAPTVQLRDSFGNPVAMAGVTVTLQPNPLTTRSRTVRGALSATTDATGLAAFANLSGQQAGAYTLSAEAAEITSALSSPFQITAGTAASIQATGGTPQSATVLTPFPQSLQATVKDGVGNPVGGVTVVFAAPVFGASAALSAGQATTDASGQASVTATANAIAGSYTVAATVAGIAPAGFNLANVAAGASTLAFVQQPVNTPAGAAMSAAVKLADSSGNPIAGVNVTLTVAGNAATLVGTTTAATDANGLATFANLSIDTTGTFQLQAAAGALSVLSTSFQITPAPSRTIAPVDGGGQSAAVNAAYALPLRAVVRDGLGNAVPGASVTFSAPASGASVAFADSTTVTADNQGVAISPALTANGQPGSFDVIATTDNAPSPAAFHLTNLARAANRLTFVQQPTSTTAGQIMTPPVTVQVRDSAGNPVAQAGVPVTLVFNSAANLRSQTAAALTDATGLAIFASLNIAQAGTYTAQAQATGLASAQSAPFVITANIPSKILATGGTPQSAPVSTAFPEVLQATLTDASGNPVSGVPVVFQAPLAGAGATFGGTASVTVMTDQQGKAAAAITANNVAGTYIVTATTSLVTGEAQFVQTNLPLSLPSLAFSQQPGNALAGQTIAPPVTVRIVDSSGAPVPTSGVPVALSLASGSGTLSGTTVRTTDGTGTATFGDLSIDQVGLKQLRAISGMNAPAVSSTFQVSAGPATGIAVISGSPQSTTPSQEFPSLLQVQVLDSQGNPSPGVNVSFAAPTTGPSGSFAGAPIVTTDANGFATAPQLTANSTSGDFNVTASAKGVASPAAFALTILPHAAGALQVQPAQIIFAGEFGQSAPAPQTVQVANTDGRIEMWTAVSSAPWLSVNPPAGATPAPVNVSVNPAGLEAGFYSGTVAFTTPTGQASLFVVYRITPKPALQVSPSSLLFLGLQQGAPPAQTLTVTSTGRAIAYQVTASVSSPAGSNWLQVGSAQGQTPGTVPVSVNTAGLSAGVYHGSVTLTPTEAGLSSVTVSVTLALGAAVPAPVITSVTNSASFHPGGAPGALMTIFGNGLSDAVHQAASLPLPNALGPTSVTVNGALVPINYVSPTQINFQMPSGLGAGTVQVVVSNTALQASSAAYPVVLTAVDPGLFVTPDGRAAALNQDLSLHTAATPQPPGAIIVLYLTGQGPTSPPVPDGTGAPASPPFSMVLGQVAAQIGGKPAEVVFAGLTPGLVGETQINVRIPQGVDPGDRPVFVTVNGVSSNAGSISVK
jgi:adhesin/invasin